MIFVARGAHEARRPVIGDLVEGVRAEHGLPVILKLLRFEDREQGAALSEPGRRRMARPVEKGRQDIGEGDQIGVFYARVTTGPADDQRQMHAGIVKRGLGIEEGRTVVGEEDDERVIGKPCLFQFIENHADALIEAVDRAVIIGQFVAHLRQVGQEGRHGHCFGRKDAILDAGIGAVIAEAAAGLVAMRINEADGEEEGLLLRFRVPEKGSGAVGRPAHIALPALLAHLPWIDRIRADMDLADNPGLHAGGVQKSRGGFHMIEGHEVVIVVVEAVLSGLMRVQAGIDHRAAGRARGGGGERHVEACAGFGKPVDIGRRDRGLAVAASHASEIVGDQEEDIAHGAARLSGTMASPLRGNSLITAEATSMPRLSAARSDRPCATALR